MGHTCNNQFDSSGGEQNVAQGDHAIGKQVNVTQTVIGDGCIFSGTGNVTVNGISPQVFAEYVSKLAVTEAALASFFKILEEQQVPLGDLDSKLREIAAQHKELLARLEIVQSEDPQVLRLKGEARQAIEAGDYAKAEELLNQAEARDVQAIEELEQAARQRRISAAASCADNAKLQELQYRYAKAAAYWQKAAALLPEESKKAKGYYLGEAGNGLYCIAKYSEALSLYEQSLAIRREISDRVNEGALLNNISQIYKSRGDYTIALKYVEQSIVIQRETGNRQGEGATLNNIGLIYQAIGDYPIALKYFEQSLSISQEIGDRALSGANLNNIGQTYKIQGDYPKALSYLEQGLTICRDLGNKEGEAATLNNIGQIYDIQGHSTVALKYLKQSLTICQEIGDRAAEGRILNSIGQFYMACSNSSAALSYFEQGLAIQREIGDRAGEAVTNWNICFVYIEQRNISRAEQHISRAVQLAEEIGHPSLKKYRQGLREIRYALRGKQGQGAP